MKSLLSGIDTNILSKFGVVDTPLVQDPGSQQVQPAKKNRRRPGGEHETFSDQLKDDQGWIYEKLNHDRNFLTNLITTSLREYLLFHGHTFVVRSFLYRKSEMDIMSLSNEYLTEYEIKTCRQDYAKDFNKLVYMGKPVKKHHLLKSGQWIANRFYYVCQENLIDVDHVPEYAGLIVFSEETRKFKILKYAPWLQKNRVPPGFYKTLATKLYTRCMNLIQPGRTANHSEYQILNRMKYDQNPINDKDHPEYNSTDQGNINTEG